MPDYRQFDPEALAADERFQRWQLLGDPVDGAFWQEWLRQNPEQAGKIEKAAELLRILHGAYEQRLSEDVPLSDQEIQAEIRQLHEALREPNVRRVSWFQLTPVRYGMAASLLILISLFGWYAFRSVNVKSADPYGERVSRAAGPLSEIVNTTDQPRRIDLPDRSVITLYPNSRVSYDNQFSGTRREIFLSGKAQFTVTKNPARPFYVYANGLTTKVLGTQFTVQAYAGATDVKVVVRSGKVAVFGPNRTASTSPDKANSTNGVVLTPNQQLVFSPTQTRLVKSLVEQPTPLERPAQRQPLRFRRAPIAEVFAALSQSYGINIVFDADVMRACQLTASLADEPLFEQLDLICHTINARYEQVNGEIIIASRGCP